MADSGLTAADLPRLGSALPAVLEERWPGVASLVQDGGLDIADLVWGRRVYPVDHARSVLGYRPRYDVSAFLDALRREDLGHYPYAQQSRWGVGPTPS